LYVGNLAPATTENDLRRLFAQSGTVTSVNLIKDRTSGLSKGFAFVTMSSAAGAQKAVAKLNKFELAGRPLKVNLAEQRSKAPGAQPGKAPEGFQSKLGAFFIHTGNSSNTGGPKTRPSGNGKPTGGYQSKLGAYGAGNSAPNPNKRRGNR
jgi:RNA recognition motif-containing protein